MSKIILFYKYIDIRYPEQVRKWQHNLTSELGLKGRVIIATEGINATLGGTNEALEAYIQAMTAHPLFSNIDYKESEGSTANFPRLRVVVKKEIVHLGVDPKALTPEQGGVYLTPAQTHDLIASKPDDLIILDTRNWYESRVGTFTGALTPQINTFREFPNYIEEHLDTFKDKQVLMFCTGGVRCERATAYLKVKNVAKQVYQIAGGIHRYIEQFPQGFFRGKNYVFDGRISVKANSDVLSSCSTCNSPCDDFSNCTNASCNKQFIVCDLCIRQWNSACSPTCFDLVEKKLVPIRTKPAKTSCSLALR